MVADGSREDQGADHLGHDRDRLAAMHGLGPSGNDVRKQFQKRPGIV